MDESRDYLNGSLNVERSVIKICNLVEIYKSALKYPASSETQTFKWCI
jgi:hypothetical protein